MSNQIIRAGLNALLGTSGFASGATVTPLRLDGSLTDTCVRQITAATNATPIVCTTDSAHGWTSGDLVVVFANGSNGNTAAIGTFRIASASGSSFALQSIDEDSPQNTTGNGTWAGTAGVINLTALATLADCSGARSGGQADKQLSNCVITGDGVIDADDPAAWTTFTGVVSAFLISIGSSVSESNVPLVLQDGRECVRVAATAAQSATSIAVYPLNGPIASGTQIVFTNGVTATLSAGAVAGDVTLTVNALSAQIPVRHNGDAQVTGSGLPASVTSGTLTETFSSGANRIAKL